MSGEGFMLNLLSVMQQLSVKINTAKIDAYYPNHPKSRANIKEDTRLKSTSQQAAEWVQKLSEYNF